MKLSIIIPVYNEENTILEAIDRVLAVDILNAKKEIVVVDDGSSDGTTEKLSKTKSKNVKVILHRNNQGKGAAVKTGIENSTGDYIIIQDADLEYNPKDMAKLLRPISEGKIKVVYGTRLKRLPSLSKEERTPQFLLHYVGNKFLSLLTSILYGQWITDMETCYKLFPAKAVGGMKLNAKRFDFEPEITAKLLKKGYKILEVPISTIPRSYDEGKKLNTFRDGIIALWTLFKYRFIN